MAFVIDVNVAVVANIRESDAPQDCIQSCINLFKKIFDGDIVVLDSMGLILEEYRNRLRSSGQPGIGDAFMKYVHDNSYNPERCEMVDLTPIVGSTRLFHEYPVDPALVSFDPNDKKYVAVACASSLAPEIANAVDTDWWEFRGPLKKNGYRIPRSN